MRIRVAVSVPCQRQKSALSSCIVFYRTRASVPAAQAYYVGFDETVACFARFLREQTPILCNIANCADDGFAQYCLVTQIGTGCR